MGAATISTTSAVPPPMFDLDQTNKTPVGKILVEIHDLKHFPYFNDIYVRVSCNPWVVQTKNIIDVSLSFKQKFYLPVHNTFNTVKVEVINSLNDGWLRNHVKDVIIA